MRKKRFVCRLLLLLLLLGVLTACQRGDSLQTQEETEEGGTVLTQESLTENEAQAEGGEESDDAEEETQAESGEQSLSEVDYPVYCLADSVNIRNAPDLSGEVVGVAEYGDCFSCTAVLDSGWLRILYQEQVCYVYQEYFGEELPQTQEELTSEETTAAYTVIAGTGIYYAGSGPLVAIDAGHQLYGDSATEPNGPGSSTLKARVTSGTTGVASGVPEYQLTLRVALKLRDALLAEGYAVLMIRETNEVSISNAERAELANAYGADIFLRIHANGSSDSSVTGTLTMAPSTSNPYCSEIAEASQRLSTYLVNAICAETGFVNRGVSITDTMTGINWCTMPVSIIEMGFMSNAQEDLAMQTEEVQNQIVQGIVNAVNQYFGR